MSEKEIKAIKGEINSLINDLVEKLETRHQGELNHMQQILRQIVWYRPDRWVWAVPDSIKGQRRAK